MVIDIHCHIMVPEVEQRIEQVYSREQIVANEPYDRYAGQPSREHNRSIFPELIPKLTEPERRLRDMDRMGVDIQALATFVSQLYYWTDAELGAELARLQNDRLGEIVSDHPDRFVALGTVPMQDTVRAVAELERIMADPVFHGVQISTNVAGRDLDDPRFGPFFAAAERLGAAILMHPNGFTEGCRFADYYMVNVVGNPLDSTIALTRLIFGGVLASHPNLKLCVVHGGGYLPTYSARMDHAFEVRPECRLHIDRPPSSYLRRVRVDTMVFSPRALRHLIDAVGTPMVLLGTDYPFDMGETDPRGLIRSVEGLTDDDVAAICGANSARFLAME